MRVLFILLLCGLCASAQIVKSGWTSTSDANAARLALGILNTNPLTVGLDVYDLVVSNSLTIGTGSNAITLRSTNSGTIAAPDVAFRLLSVTTETNTADEGNFSAISLNGDRITTWPSGGGGDLLLTAGGIVLYESYSTNFAVVAALTNLGLFTNGYYSATWISTNGSALEIESSADGVTWSEGSETTNSVYLRLVVALANLDGSTAAVSNLSIMSIRDLTVYRGTNDYRSTVVMADDPAGEDHVATKRYVDTVALPTSWAQYPASTDVLMKGHKLNINSAWSLKTLVVSNEIRVALDFAGTPLLELSPGFKILTNGAGLQIVDGTYTTINVPTNQAGPFRVLCSTNDMVTFWEVAATNSHPTAVGTNYTLTFPKMREALPYLFYVGTSNAPRVRIPALSL